ncbi:glycoside hydrolase N-terminal domain-containing protein [Paenibacillus dendritiformis]|uniref:glycosyl hydrolase family 95 catalytic domain-containing protein n=1 Tax=Paenibacillus dendritiformis TaxID=130049 RepID=UPI00248C9DB2|nr:glycoside hydrolase N-terminal domain-containing protein [Paenibacillus dendritiformis]WGU96479.1 glycoside hydrolase N-terminal domain-containing protein [Paenibacillus dendritiformis]
MHTVSYENAPSGWNEALPLGNGHFGGMMFFEDNKLTLAMNHYEVYYRKLHRYSQAYSSGERRPYRKMYGRTYEELKERAREMYRDPEREPLFLYGDALSEHNLHRRYGKPAGGVSHYPTGELALYPSSELADPDRYVLQLDVEQACVRLRIEQGEDELEACTIIAQDGDYVLCEIRQTCPSLLEAVSLSLPARRYAEMATDYWQVDDTTFCYRGSFYPDGEDREANEPFSFLVMTRIAGAKGIADISADGMRIRLEAAEPSLTLLTTVVTEAPDLEAAALERLNREAARVERLKASHRAHWTRFWERSSVSLPDPLLEDLWHINLYAIACSSGKGGSMGEQACGLNGLWDIKQPTKWGSMWYWDVNIQAAFWPLYTANHLEIAEAFNDGLLSYAGEAERMAREFYGQDGIAGDYPHALYYSIWPWCAQFLWDYYRYSLDRQFLKEKAYPLFKRILRFFEGIVEADGESGTYAVFPDISPEQGPLTRNSVSTLSTVKHLLRIAIEANRLLGESEEDCRRWSELAERLAPYPAGESKRYGPVLRDSEWAPADMHLRHPSLLMPIYPIGELSKHSAPELRQLAENTLRYAEHHTEYGVFQFGWLSCAASRLGKGNAALRLLYEQGIDLSLRSNGLFAEETERWMNYCNITNEPLYHPHMMEASGEVVAAINEMLLQSWSGAIEVFPAIPSGEPEPEQMAGLYAHEVGHKVRHYAKWDECSFRNLLAAGAFEVSAALREGRTAWIRLKSKAGQRAVLVHPFGPEVEAAVARMDESGWSRIPHHLEQGRLVFGTEAGGEYAVYPAAIAVDGLSLLLCGEAGAEAVAAGAAAGQWDEPGRSDNPGEAGLSGDAGRTGEVGQCGEKGQFGDAGHSGVADQSGEMGQYGKIGQSGEVRQSSETGLYSEAGQSGVAGKADARRQTAVQGSNRTSPRVREAHTGRRVFLGKDWDTRHYQLLDHFTFDYYAGNYRESRLAAYRIDCGPGKWVKDYGEALPRQVHMDGIVGQTFRPLTPQMAFTPYAGFGWAAAGELIAEDRGAPDELRRDFIGGTEEATLLIELPRGRYDLLFVSGDSASPSYTIVEIEGQSVWQSERPLRAGEFATDIVPIAQKRDGFAAIRFRAGEGLPWRVNVLIVNKNYPYL